MKKDHNNQQTALDEYIHLSVSDDGLLAKVTLLASDQQVQIERDELVSFLQKNSVIYGIEEEVVDNIVHNYNQLIGEEVIIARGKEPINGEDSVLVPTYNLNQQAGPRRLENGQVDYYHVQDIQNVEKGKLIATKKPATDGIDGITVGNQIIRAKAGKDFKIKQGKNVVIDNKSGSIYAAVSGQISTSTGNVINVFPVYEVNGDVDFSIGNIDFVGNVVIRGNVPNGFKIKAAGDIRVWGGVEGAELISGGSIFIQSGITGQHKAFLHAAKDIHASFLIHCQVEAGENIVISQSIMHTIAKAGKKIDCVAAKGLIIGGELKAGESVTCRTVGNMMATPTNISVGEQAELIERQQSNEKRREELNASLYKTDQAIQILDRIKQSNLPLSSEKEELYDKLVNTKHNLEVELQDIYLEQLSIDEALQTKDNHSFIKIHGVVHAGTRLVFGKYIKYIKSNQQRVLYFFENNEIKYKQIV